MEVRCRALSDLSSYLDNSKRSMKAMAMGLIGTPLRPAHWVLTRSAARPRFGRKGLHRGAPESPSPRHGVVRQAGPGGQGRAPGRLGWQGLLQLCGPSPLVDPPRSAMPCLLPALAALTLNPRTAAAVLCRRPDPRRGLEDSRAGAQVQARRDHRDRRRRLHPRAHAPHGAQDPDPRHLPRAL